MWPPKITKVCALDTISPVIGNVPISWSQDYCLAVGTERYASMYDLNPFPTPSDASMHFKTQHIPIPPRLKYDCGINEKLKEFDRQRNQAMIDGCPPDFDVYRAHLDHSLHEEEDETIKSRGVKALAFSPIESCQGGGTLFALLSVSHRLLIYAKSSEGPSVQWSLLKDVSGVLVDILKNNDGFYPSMTPPSKSSFLKNAGVRRHAACINSFSWSSIHTKASDGTRYLYLVTSTKLNYLIVWRFGVPFTATSRIAAFAYVKAFDDGVVSCVSFSDDFTGGITIAVGNTNGRVMVVSVDHRGNEIFRASVWDDDDELSVHCMDWKLIDDNTGSGNSSVLVLAKASFLISLRMTGLVKTSERCLRRRHTLNVESIIAINSTSWIVASREGEIGRLNYNVSSNELTWDCVSEGDNSDPSGMYDYIHGTVLSPNQMFRATLRSNSKTIVSIVDPDQSVVDITTFASGTEAFEMLCNQAHDSPPGMDALESIRLHLLRAELAQDPSEQDLLAACVEHYIDAPSACDSLKWCFTKVCLSVFETPKFDTLLSTVEKRITARQMLRVIRAIKHDRFDTRHGRVPVRGIVEWLKSNCDLTADEVEMVESVEASGKFPAEETCSVTGENLRFSADGHRAVTEIAGIEWPRCHFTFRALTELRYPRCELTNSCVASSDSALKELQSDRCLYSGLPMI